MATLDAEIDAAANGRKSQPDQPPKGSGRKAPPKTGGPNPSNVKSARPRPAGRTGRPSKAELKQQLADGIDQLAGMLLVAGLANERLAYDGRIVAENSERLAAELFRMAERSPAVARVLQSLFTVSDIGQTIAVFAAVGVPIAANHGLLPMAAVAMVKAEMPPERPKKEKRPKTPKPAPAGQSDLFVVPDPPENGNAPGPESVKDSFTLGWSPDQKPAE